MHIEIGFNLCFSVVLLLIQYITMQSSNVIENSKLDLVNSLSYNLRISSTMLIPQSLMNESLLLSVGLLTKLKQFNLFLVFKRIRSLGWTLDSILVFQINPNQLYRMSNQFIQTSKHISNH